MDRQFIPVDPELFESINNIPGWNDAVKVGNMVWTTGQIGWDKSTGEIVDGFENQARKALENLKTVLERAGASMEDVVLTRNYLVNHDDYPIFSRVYDEFFPADSNTPARVTVVVKDHIDHALIDLEAVAVIREGS